MKNLVWVVGVDNYYISVHSSQIKCKKHTLKKLLSETVQTTNTGGSVEKKINILTYKTKHSG